MTELYLIAHKVRGEPAFDIATKMHVEALNEDFWIIPTSGHRAYPYWSTKLESLIQAAVAFFQLDITFNAILDTMPPDHPDHYEPSAAPKGTGKGDLLYLIGLETPIKRRHFNV